MLKKLNKILGIVLSVLIIIIIAITAYSLVQIQILKRDYINLFGYTMFEVATGSMSGSIEIDDVVIVKLINNHDELKIDDIIVFKKDNSLITHRLIQMNGNTVIAKGDANNTEDDPIEKEAIVGKVSKIIPKVGIWKKVFSTPEVYISILTTLILFGITISYFKSDNSKLGNKEKNNE